MKGKPREDIDYLEAEEAANDATWKIAKGEHPVIMAALYDHCQIQDNIPDLKEMKWPEIECDTGWTLDECTANYEHVFGKMRKSTEHKREYFDICIKRFAYENPLLLQNLILQRALETLQSSFKASTVALPPREKN